MPFCLSPKKSTLKSLLQSHRKILNPRKSLDRKFYPQKGFRLSVSLIYLRTPLHPPGVVTQLFNLRQEVLHDNTNNTCTVH